MREGKIMKKLNKKKGFTLAELLIVVAIIAILVAIAVPVFGGALTEAQIAVENANKRAARAQASVDFIVNHKGEKKALQYVYIVTRSGEMKLDKATTPNPSEGVAGTKDNCEAIPGDGDDAYKVTVTISGEEYDIK